MEPKLYPVAILCDLHLAICKNLKAFDCVDHGLLFEKLCTFGFRGKVLDSLTSYLSSKMQFVQVSVRSVEAKLRVTLSSLPIIVGVPQRSMVGPLLFSLLLKDIDKFLSDFAVICYANDITIIISEGGDNIQTVYIFIYLFT